MCRAMPWRGLFILRLFCNSDLRQKYDIQPKVRNIFDIKFHFWYTFLLNHCNTGDQFMNVYLQKFYPSIGPNEAFDLWWSVFVLKYLGKILKATAPLNKTCAFVLKASRGLKN